MNEDPRPIIEFLNRRDLHEFLGEEAPRGEQGRISRAQKAFGPWAQRALEQLNIREKAKNKVPSLHRRDWLFTQRSLEQCTSEAVARVKSAWLRSHTFTDLTAGAGVDAFFVAQQNTPTNLAERDPLLHSMIAHNFRHVPQIRSIARDGLAFIQPESTGQIQSRTGAGVGASTHNHLTTVAGQGAIDPGLDAPASPKADGLIVFLPETEQNRAKMDDWKVSGVPTGWNWPEPGLGDTRDSSVEPQIPPNRHPPGHAAYLDPDRRPGGRRTFSWREAQPNVPALMPSLCELFDSVWVKSSPMTDPTASIREWAAHTTDVFAISWQGELKEILFRIQKQPGDGCRFHAVHIHEEPDSSSMAATTETPAVPRHHVFTRNSTHAKSPLPPAAVPQAGDLLFEPHGGLIRLNLSAEFAVEMGFAAIGPHTPYYIVSSGPEFHYRNLPGRLFRVRAVLPYQPRTLAPQLKAMGIQSAMIASKDFYLSVAELRTTLKIRDGADAYLIFTTLFGKRPVCMVATRLTASTFKG